MEVLSQSLFDHKEFKSAIEMTKIYRCAGNAMWSKICAHNNVPYNREKILKIEQTYVPTVTDVLPFTLRVGVLETHPLLAKKCNEVSQHLSNLPLVSPEELLHVVIFRIAADIDDEQPLEILQKWRTCLLNVSYEFKLYSSEADIGWDRIQMREDTVKAFQLLARTTVERIFEVSAIADDLHSASSFKKQPTVGEVVKAWAKNVSLAEGAEKVTDGYVDSAMTVRRRILSDKIIVQYLMASDGYKSPWNSAYTIETVARKVGTGSNAVERMRWVFATVDSRWRDPDYEVGEMSFRQFSGKGQPSNRGTCDLLLFKYNLWQHLTSVELSRLICSEDSKAQLLNSLGSHEQFAQSKGRSQIWIGLLENQARLFFQLASQAVFGREFDGCLKLGLRAGKSASESLSEGALGQAWQEVQNAKPQQASLSIRAHVDVGLDVAQSVEERHSIALGGERDEKVMDQIKKAAFQDDAKLKHFEDQAAERVTFFCEILTEMEDAKHMAEAFQSTALGKLRGENDDSSAMIPIFYTSKLAGEMVTQPQYRPPILRKDSNTPGGNHIKKMISAVLLSRQPEDHSERGQNIHDGDCFVISDAGKHGNQQAIMSVFCTPDNKPLQKTVKTLQCFYDEEDHTCYYH